MLKKKNASEETFQNISIFEQSESNILRSTLLQ